MTLYNFFNNNITLKNCDKNIRTKNKIEYNSGNADDSQQTLNFSWNKIPTLILPIYFSLVERI